MEINFLISLFISIAGIASGYYLFAKIRICFLNDEITNYPKISIIIPARNEEENLKILLPSIRKQVFKDYELIVVNDQSDDKTEEIAKNYNASVITSAKLPDGWLGKPWACWQGAEAAKGEILLFLDADTFLDENGLKKIADTFLTEEKNLDKYQALAMSVAPFHFTEDFYEDFSVFFNIIMLSSMNAFTPGSNDKSSGLIGQSLIIRKNNYFSTGGHKSAKDKILENVFYASKLKSENYKLICLAGKKTLSFRMYPDGFKKLINGWTKAFASGAGQTPASAMIPIILMLSAGFSLVFLAPYNLLNEIHQSSTIIFYLCYSFLIFYISKAIGKFSFLTWLFFPIYMLFYLIVFIRSVYYQLTKKKIDWKNREVSNKRA